MNDNSIATLLPREDLRIVVLGPGKAQPPDLKKRKQIARRLKSRGYLQAKLGEELLGNPDIPLHIALLNALDAIDLVLVLNTGSAPLTELTYISQDSRAREITRVWTKREYQANSRSTPGDVLKMFDNWFFDGNEFETCELVGEFLQTADKFCFNKAQSEGRLFNLRLLSLT